MDRYIGKERQREERREKQKSKIKRIAKEIRSGGGKKTTEIT